MENKTELLERDLLVIQEAMKKEGKISIDDIDKVVENLSEGLIKKVDPESENWNERIQNIIDNVEDVSIYFIESSVGCIVVGIDEEDSVGGRLILENLEYEVKDRLEKIEVRESIKQYYYDYVFDEDYDEEDYDEIDLDDEEYGY